MSKIDILVAMATNFSNYRLSLGKNLKLTKNVWLSFINTNSKNKLL